MADLAQDIFFSYSREDSQFVLRLAADLKAAGAKVFLDEQNIRAGQEWDRAIEAALDHIPRMILVLSPSASESKNVRDEISLAIDRDKEIVPVLYRACNVPIQVRRLQFIDFQHGYEDGLSALLGRLRLEHVVVPERTMLHRPALWASAALVAVVSAILIFSLTRRTQFGQSRASKAVQNSDRAEAVSAVRVDNAPPTGVAQRESRTSGGLRFQVQNLMQATPLIAQEQPRINGEPVWCESATLNLVLAHDLVGEAPLVVNQLGIDAQPVAPEIPASVDCAIDTLRSKPWGDRRADQFAFDISRVGISGRFIQSGRPREAFLVNPTRLLSVGADQNQVTLARNEVPKSYHISVRAKTPGLYKIWFTASYDASGPRTAKSESFLLGR